MIPVALDTGDPLADRGEGFEHAGAGLRFHGPDGGVDFGAATVLDGAGRKLAIDATIDGAHTRRRYFFNGLLGIAAVGVSAWLWSRTWSEDGASDSAPSEDARQVEVVNTDAPAVPGPDFVPGAVTRPAERSESTISAASVAANQIHGQLVDDTTGAPIQGVIVTIGKDADELASTTTVDGRFAFEMPPSIVRFSARLANGSKVPLKKRQRVVRAVDLPIELRARIGPRFLNEIVGPRDAQEAEWSARLIERLKFPSGPTRDRDLVSAQPLEGGDPRSVRFAKRPSRPSSASALLVIHDATGQWSGEVAAPVIAGEHPDVIQITVTRSGTLIGRVLQEGRGPFKRVSIHMTPAGSRTWPPIAGPWSMVRADAQGDFRFEGLTAQDYFVRIAPPSLPMIQMRITIAPGQHDLGTIEVPAGGEPGDVSGVIKSVSGRGGIGAILQLESLDGTGWAQSTLAGSPGDLIALFYGGRPAQDAAEDHGVPFRIADVPAGHYRLVVVPWDGRRYESTVVELDAPTDDVVILREDSAEEVEIVFEVTDAGTGQRIETYMARFHTARWGKEKSFPHRSGEVIGRTAPDGDLSWEVFAHGYVPVHGDASAFAGSGAARAHHVELRRGWGAEFVVRDGADPRRHHDRAVSKLSIPAPGELPLAGVAVFADGERVGTTDASGRARIELSAEPKRLEFQLDGWAMTPTTTFADSKVLHDCPNPKVWLVKPDR